MLWDRIGEEFYGTLYLYLRFCYRQRERNFYTLGQNSLKPTKTVFQWAESLLSLFFGEMKEQKGTLPTFGFL